MKDIRTPDTYFAKAGTLDDRLKEVKSKLDDLLASIRTCQKKKGKTPAEKQILEITADKADRLLYKTISSHYAKKVIEAVAYGTPADATNAVHKALNFKCRYRVEPTLMATGAEIQKQLFK